MSFRDDGGQVGGGGSHGSIMAGLGGGDDIGASLGGITEQTPTSPTDSVIPPPPGDSVRDQDNNPITTSPVNSTAPTLSFKSRLTAKREVKLVEINRSLPIDQQVQQLALIMRGRRQELELKDGFWVGDEVRDRGIDYCRSAETNLALPSIVTKMQNQPALLDKFRPSGKQGSAQSASDSGFLSKFLRQLDLTTPNLTWQPNASWLDKVATVLLSPYNLIYKISTALEIAFSKLGSILRTPFTVPLKFERLTELESDFPRTAKILSGILFAFPYLVYGLSRFVLSPIATLVSKTINRVKAVMDSSVHMTYGILQLIVFGVGFATIGRFSPQAREYCKNQISNAVSRMSTSLKAILSVVFNLVPILARTTNNVAVYPHSESRKLLDGIGTTKVGTQEDGQFRTNMNLHKLSVGLGGSQPSKAKRGSTTVSFALFGNSFHNPSLQGKIIGGSHSGTIPIIPVLDGISLLEQLSYSFPNYGYLDKEGNLDGSMIAQSLYTVAVYAPLTLIAFGIKALATILGLAFHNVLKYSIAGPQKTTGSIPVRFLATFASFLLLPVLIVSHFLHLVGNAVEHTRGLIDGVVNMLTCIPQLMALPFTSNTSNNIGIKFKIAASCLFRSIFNLIPTAIIIGIYFIPIVGQFVGPVVQAAATAIVQGGAGAAIAGFFTCISLATLASATLAATAAFKKFAHDKWVAALTWFGVLTPKAQATTNRPLSRLTTTTFNSNTQQIRASERLRRVETESVAFRAPSDITRADTRTTLPSVRDDRVPEEPPDTVTADVVEMGRVDVDVVADTAATPGALQREISTVTTASVVNLDAGSPTAPDADADAVAAATNGADVRNEDTNNDVEKCATPGPK